MRSRPAPRVVLALLLAAAVLAVFWPALGHDFVNYDDDLYVTRNPWVQQGLTWASARWALTTDAAGNWHPLTWLSHQLDWKVWGPRPFGHHATSVVLHVMNTLLLFALLDLMTGSPWRSALAAALFALHPLHVESVAWVAERKDVLSTCLWFLTLLAYAPYTRRPGAGRYLLVMLGLALGLMAKPMVVTLPCTLLLLDYWPLGRFRRAQDLVPLAREKLPLFALVAVASVVTWRVQSAAGAVLPMPLANRLGHALVTYVAYLWKMLWPADLAAMYPHPGVEAPLVVLLSALLLALLTAVAIVERRRRPFLLVGWLWYLGTLVPVIGLVQVGAVAMADRFTYVPLVGVFVAIAWLVPATPAPRVVAAAAGVVLALLAARAWMQVHVWRDSATLFANTLAVDEANPLAHVNLAVALDARGDLDGAATHLERALVLRPGMVTAHVSLGNNLARKGRYEEAIAQYRAAIAADPGSARALNNLGWVQLRLGRLDEAIDSLERALRIEPGLATAENDLGMALARRGDNAAARSHFERAVAADPRYAEAHNNLAAVLLSEGHVDEAIAHAERAIAAQPAFAEAHANRIVGFVRRGRYRDAWAAVRAARAARVNLPDWLVSALAERMPDPGA